TSGRTGPGYSLPGIRCGFCAESAGMLPEGHSLFVNRLTAFMTSRTLGGDGFMKISLHPEHLKRYEEIARLFLRYGHGDLVAASGLDQALAGKTPEAAPAVTPNAEDLADDLERMGPIYVKLGQVLSSRPDLLPPAYVKALSRLQNRLAPFPYAE